ncbi:MAG TPA: hypothetical protein VF844_15175 [Ktedonobacteraceae bacterium]
MGAEPLALSMARYGKPLAIAGHSATRAAAPCTLWTSTAHVDEQISKDKERIYAIMDNLEMHHCRDLLLFMIHHPRS